MHLSQNCVKKKKYLSIQLKQLNKEQSKSQREQKEVPKIRTERNEIEID